MTTPSMHWASSANPSASWLETVGWRPRGAEARGKSWIAWDIFSVAIAVAVATLYGQHANPEQAARELVHGALVPGRSMGMLLIFLGGFITSLVLISRRLNLYNPRQFQGYLHEQRLSLQACLSAGLLLAGALYLIRADDIPRSIVVGTVALSAVLLGTRRMVYRAMLDRSMSRGENARNVLILGVGPRAFALRRYLERKELLGYRFKGFVPAPGEEPDPEVKPSEIVCDVDSLFDCARKRFVEEILVAAPYKEWMTAYLLNGARAFGIDLRVIPEMYDGLTWQHPIEYIGQVPTIPIHSKEIPELGLAFKRGFDFMFSLVALTVVSPLLALIALAIKIDSRGPAFYSSERIGKKGRVFRCIKFRTMVKDADRRLCEIQHMNERDGVLFKVSNDPRITRMGRWLRKYSLDELPQFFNVLRGEMSVVGPRPAIASEVSQYDLGHLRRLDVTPGITGLWQVQGRQDPSFMSYVSLDCFYIDSWTVWLDFKIILRTIGVVLAGTGS